MSVSYTHLTAAGAADRIDIVVGFGKVLFPVAAHAEPELMLSRPVFIPPEDTVLLPLKAHPVSYTHLDVYKRQVRHTLQRFKRQAPLPELRRARQRLRFP